LEKERALTIGPTRAREPFWCRTMPPTTRMEPDLLQPLVQAKHHALGSRGLHRRSHSVHPALGHALHPLLRLVLLLMQGVVAAFAPHRPSRPAWLERLA